MGHSVCTFGVICFTVGLRVSSKLAYYQLLAPVSRAAGLSCGLVWMTTILLRGTSELTMRTRVFPASVWGKNLLLSVVVDARKTFFSTRGKIRRVRNTVWKLENLIITLHYIQNFKTPLQKKSTRSADKLLIINGHTVIRYSEKLCLKFTVKNSSVA